MRTFIKIIGLLLVVLLTACGGGGGSAGTTSVGGSTVTGTSATTSTATTTATTTTTASNSNASVARLIVSSANTLNADGTSSATITVQAVDSGNALVPNAVINVSATNNVILSTGLITTGSSGGGAVLMFGSSADQTNRVSTFTAACTGCAAAAVTTQIQIAGASVALSNTLGALIIGGPSATLTATVRNIFNAVMPGVPVSFAVTDSNILGLSAITATTNSSGVASVSVSGIGAGSAAVNVSALGNAKAQAYTSGTAGSVLTFSSPANNAAMTTGTPQVITVSAPGATTVTFASTLGKFGNGASSQIVAVVGGVASASLTSNQAGTASVNAVDNLSRSVALTLVVAPTTANKLTVNAASTTLQPSSATFQSSVIVTARAFFNNGVTDQSVANAPIIFSMAGGPGAGEFLTPAFAFTNSAGIATATFYAGTAASIANGITISASISGTTVATGVSPSGNGLLVTIGGSALSVAVGRASVLRSSSDSTLYLQDYSVQVLDANNNPVNGAVVTLRVQPFAFATGPACTPQATYCSEDINGNGSLDAGEDGYRKLIGISELSYSASLCPNPSVSTGTGAITFNALLTPANSDGGSVPSTVTTDPTGTAPFTMTYLKSSAFWIVNKLTATVSSSGTESSNSSIFRLQPTTVDVGPPCALPASPYAY